jgi:hypothetical protein
VPAAPQKNTKKRQKKKSLSLLEGDASANPPATAAPDPAPASNPVANNPTANNPTANNPTANNPTANNPTVPPATQPAATPAANEPAAPVALKPGQIRTVDGGILQKGENGNFSYADGSREGWEWTGSSWKNGDGATFNYKKSENGWQGDGYKYSEKGEDGKSKEVLGQFTYDGKSSYNFYQPATNFGKDEALDEKRDFVQSDHWNPRQAGQLSPAKRGENNQFEPVLTDSFQGGNGGAFTSLEGRKNEPGFLGTWFAGGAQGMD